MTGHTGSEWKINNFSITVSSTALLTKTGNHMKASQVWEEHCHI